MQFARIASYLFRSIVGASRVPSSGREQLSLAVVASVADSAGHEDLSLGASLGYAFGWPFASPEGNMDRRDATPVRRQPERLEVPRLDRQSLCLSDIPLSQMAAAPERLDSSATEATDGPQGWPPS